MGDKKRASTQSTVCAKIKELNTKITPRFGVCRKRRFSLLTLSSVYLLSKPNPNTKVVHDIKSYFL